MEYKDYLKTSHWLNKRKEVLDFWDNSCSVCCSKFKLHVHHRKYNLFKERIQDCVVLCENCHNCHHEGMIDFWFNLDELKSTHNLINTKLGYELAKRKDILTLMENGFDSALKEYDFPKLSSFWENKQLTNPEIITLLKKEIDSLEKRTKLDELGSKIIELNIKLSKSENEEYIHSIMEEMQELMLTKKKLLAESNKLSDRTS